MQLVRLYLKLEKEELYRDITAEIQEAIKACSFQNGFLLIRTAHTTCAVVVQEDEPCLMRDLYRCLDRIIPTSDKNASPGDPSYYEHDDLTKRTVNLKPGEEERVNGHSHLRTILLQFDRVLPVVEGTLALEGYQRILFLDFDDLGSRRGRTVILSFMKEAN